jgi:quercetin dioxygenase-like cupin family protein
MEKENTTNVPVAPYVQTQAQSQAMQLPGGGTVRIIATGAQTGNALGIIEMTLPPGGGSQMHIHHNEDEALYILEGELLFVAGDTRIEAEPGTFIYGPRNITHGLRVVGSEPARFVESFLPAGLEKLLGAPDELMAYLTEGRGAAKYNLEFVGPMPD